MAGAFLCHMTAYLVYITARIFSTGGGVLRDTLIYQGPGTETFYYGHCELKQNFQGDYRYPQV